MDDWTRTLSARDLAPAARFGVSDAAALWVIADTHFFHDNLRGYTSRPAGVDEIIARRWRERVAPADTVLHLGDLAFGHPTVLGELLATLPGRLLLIKGNHDRQTGATYARLGVTVIPPCVLPFGEWTLAMTHGPHAELVAAGSRRLLNVHGHIHEKLAPDLRLINVGAEWTDYAPVRLGEVVSVRSAALGARREEYSLEPPLSYADWLAETYGGPVQRSDVTRFRDVEARSVARETYQAYRDAHLAAVLGHRSGR